MKKRLLIACLLGLVISSCKVDNKLVDVSNASKILTLKETKITGRILTDNNKKVLKASSSKIGSSKKQEQIDLPNYDFDWDNHYLNKKIAGFPVIMVPLKNNVVNRSVFPDMNPKGYRIVAFQHDKNYETKASIFEIHPDTAYLNRKMMLKNIKSIGDEYADCLWLLQSGRCNSN